MLPSKYTFFYVEAQKYEKKDILQILNLYCKVVILILGLICYVCIQILNIFEKNIISITLTGQTLLVRAENAFSAFHEVWM